MTRHRLPMPARSGFTLIELLVTISIVGLLASLSIPVLAILRQRTEAAACVSNLRQIGICGLLYSADNDQKLPKIEPWPSNPVYSPEDEAKGLLEALGPYGLTEKTIVCRADLAGPNYRAKEGSSFQWCPMANGQSIVSAKLSWNNMGEDIKLDRLLVAFDYTNIHFGKSNILFGDGHVSAASEN